MRKKNYTKQKQLDSAEFQKLEFQKAIKNYFF